jgi:hypothetical protein
MMFDSTNMPSIITTFLLQLPQVFPTDFLAVVDYGPVFEGQTVFSFLRFGK